ncbi:Signal transduction histidine kinase [Micromonospora echinaurantiaca]|uniref:histidine kinase n=1 Tax=Micromonospora echinaurantiaca TaxID=47857 RepID=A0A1C5HD86_9ACTN|nr:histidine kinase [Micromonospora echinaurantiaca]SCG43965.1 Signal transduction histidine kinase [Micromonospora echinaurantiaca]
MTAHDPHPATPWSRRPVTDTAVALVVAVLTATGEFGTDFFGPTLAGLDDGVPPLWLGLPLAVGVGLLTRWRRRLPVIVLAGALLANALVPAHAAVAVALYTLAERTTAWPKVTAGTLASAVLVGVPLWWFAGADGAVPISMAVCVAPALLGMYVGTRHELVERIRERAERIEREQQQRVARARSDERAQIARDMHDLVTHRVSLMVLQATALEVAKGEEAVAIGKQLGATGREALAELRSLVAVLRNDDDAPLAPHPGLAELDGLIEESRQVGIPVTLDVASPAGERPPLLVEHTAYRFVQEALTNVHKHAPGAPTRVRVQQTPHLLRLSVSNGRGRPVTDASLPAGGHGLLGLAERVRLVGGEFTAGPTADGGFEVTAEVPIFRWEDR